MRLTTKLSTAALIALLALNSCGSNRAGDITTTTANPQDQKPVDENDLDGDGLLNDEETELGTDPRDPDSDRDGLWDGNEVKSYGTDPLNPDSDEDAIDDGREVYSCSETIFDTQKVTQHWAANDRVEEGSVDPIDALDPYNDSDGDERNNMGEKLKGTDGCDPDDYYAYITETCEAISMAGAVYIPGGFDVDEDGVNESGFWFTPYPASSTGKQLESANYENFSNRINEQFNVLNGTSLSYRTDTIFHSNPIFEPRYVEQGPSASSYLSNLYGMDLPTSIASLNVPDCVVDETTSYGVTVPSNKQYIHILKLLEAYPSDNVTIKNGLLGIDPNVPMDHEVKVHYMGDFKEYTSDIAILNGFSYASDMPAYWDVRNDNEVTNSEDLNKGKFLANTSVDVGFDAPGFRDPYAIVVRQGLSIDLTVGIGNGDTTANQEILFRMATPYLDTK